MGIVFGNLQKKRAYTHLFPKNNHLCIELLIKLLSNYFSVINSTRHSFAAETASPALVARTKILL